MKKYALLAGVCLILFMSSCKKAKLEIIEPTNILTMSEKESEKPRDNKWDKHSKRKGSSSSLSNKTNTR